MTVDTPVPIWDNSPESKKTMNALFISESGGLQSTAFGLSDRMVIKYFQRLPGDTPYIFPGDSPIEQVDSWRPHITWADMIVVDDPAFVSRMSVDFKLDDLILMYMVNDEVYKEAGRLINWLNPLTLSSLKDAMENVDIPSIAIADIKRPNLLKRMLRRLRG